MSGKALFVMDIPENGCMDCAVCKESFFKTICGITGNRVSGNRERGGFPEECPLKRLPEKKNYTVLSDRSPLGAYGNGWNDCIDEIAGGMEG